MIRCSVTLACLIFQLRMEYSFEKVQQLRFEVYDVDSPVVTKLSRQDTLGYVETSLGFIATSGPEGLTLELNGVSIPANSDQAKIILTAEEVPAEKEEVLFKLSGSSVGKWTGCLPPKLYYILFKLNEAGRYIAIYRSKGSRGRGTSPSWEQARLSLHRLCNGDYDQELKIDVYQLPLTQLVHVGSALTTLNKMLTPSEKFPIMSPKGAVSLQVCKPS